jgi:hypothetical protein
MLTQPPRPAIPLTSLAPANGSDDVSGRAHRQVIGYLGAALPFLLVVAVRVRPNAPADAWARDSISAFYWTGGVPIFAGVLAVLSVFLLTYRGYANEWGKYDRRVAIVAGVAAALTALFPTTPPAGISPPWWHTWIAWTHAGAASTLFSMFAVFSLWLFRISALEGQPDADKQRRNTIYLVCGIGIVASMAWALVGRQTGRSIFWAESSALGFFALSWLVKGRALDSVKSKVRAAKDKIGG